MSGLIEILGRPFWCPIRQQRELSKMFLSDDGIQKHTGYRYLNGGGKQRRSEMTTGQKVAYVKEHGDDAFQSLPLLDGIMGIKKN